MSNRHLAITAALIFGAAGVADGRQAADDIARAIVVGQAYISGNVYVAGFVEDEARRWPARIAGAPLQEGRAGIVADFFRTVVQDSEEQFWFPQREGDPADDDIFSTIDRAAVSDRNLARYRAPLAVGQAVSFIAWDERLPLTDISYRSAGQPRPLTAAERTEVAADRATVPKDFECTTVPQFLDDAKILLTASIAGTRSTVRLSKYSTPGCAGHLADIYVLDVIEPDGSVRRFEFRHYQGLL